MEGFELWTCIAGVRVLKIATFCGVRILRVKGFNNTELPFFGFMWFNTGVQSGNYCGWYCGKTCAICFSSLVVSGLFVHSFLLRVYLRFIMITVARSRSFSTDVMYAGTISPPRWQMKVYRDLRISHKEWTPPRLLDGFLDAFWGSAPQSVFLSFS